LRILISTFGDGDTEKVLCAMRVLPYDQLVLVGPESIVDCDGYRILSKLEEMSGHRIETELVESDDFMKLVDEVSEAIERRTAYQRRGSDCRVMINISGGGKLLGDAALFAAFRMGVEAYHCDKTVTKLPVLRGATAKDMFTSSQANMILGIGDTPKELDQAYSYANSVSRQASERVIRELRHAGLMRSEARGGRVFIQLNDAGLEVLRALRIAKSDGKHG